jgi:hypothetical protein
LLAGGKTRRHEQDPSIAAEDNEIPSKHLFLIGFLEFLSSLSVRLDNERAAACGCRRLTLQGVASLLVYVFSCWVMDLVFMDKNTAKDNDTQATSLI